ncbi:hypothetical protein KBA73_03045 [Patescibacteria group bacterium]|nr:hypothetical protein [Patescibacteria group bacterium]
MRCIDGYRVLNDFVQLFKVALKGQPGKIFTRENGYFLAYDWSDYGLVEGGPHPFALAKGFGIHLFTHVPAMPVTEEVNVCFSLPDWNPTPTLKVEFDSPAISCFASRDDEQGIWSVDVNSRQPDDLVYASDRWQRIHRVFRSHLEKGRPGKFQLDDLVFCTALLEHHQVYLAHVRSNADVYAQSLRPSEGSS